MADIRATGILDDCQRANENPLSYGGRWQTFLDELTYPLELHSNSIYTPHVTGGTAQYAFWRQDWFVGDVEAWGLIGAGIDLREGLRLLLHVTNAETSFFYRSGEQSGYRAAYDNGILGTAISISRWDNGARTTLAQVSGTWNVSGAGGMALFRRIGNDLEVWASNDYGASWIFQVGATDATYHYGHLGLGTQQDDPNPGWRGFGGGKIQHSQIYRYVSN